ncbi:vanadium-dependent haloperoxidase [Synechococcus sp. CC9616]|uniref:vanadium-dependent haloperoxidase n=1 Tax=Synechococcus sp. CC9616 TaxID=110663 RepID=UPI0006862F28|nr:vanadium-dependent haloperoxidase [Synechococcus sp. CC9616]
MSFALSYSSRRPRSGRKPRWGWKRPKPRPKQLWLEEQALLEQASVAQALPLEIDAVIPAVEELAAEVDVVVEDVEALIPDVGEIVPDVSELIPDVSELIPDVGELIPDFDEGLPDIEEGLPDVEEGFPDVVDELPDVDEGLPDVADEIPDVGDLIPDVGELIPDVGDLIPDVGELIPDVGELIPEPIEEPSHPLAEGSTLVVQWNELALQAIREDKPVPTVITRSLHLAHAAMYDAWAAFDDAAAGAYFNPRQTRRLGRRTPERMKLERAISMAAHSTLSELFPNHRDSFDQLLGELGLDDPQHPAARLGARVSRAVLHSRANDGANASGGYADTSGYQAKNAPDAEDLDPNYWTPLKVPNGSAVDDNGTPIATDDPSSYDVQAPLTPHWGGVTPFAIDSGEAFRPVAPPKFGDFTPYTDANGVVSTNDAAYRQQFTEVAELSAALTPEQKVIAEYWADGPNSSTPPGHWNEFAHDIALREEHDLEQDVKLFFALNNALFDTGIAVWDAKYSHDFVRPQTAIRYLFEDEEIEAWGGPNQGTQSIPGNSWQPYQDVTFVTPAFPEYTSGHSGFSFAAATVLEAFTGSDVLYDGVSTGVQDFDGDGEPDLIGRYTTDALAFEEYDGDPITLQWGTVWDAAAEAGRSRLYGGIHIQDGDLRAREMGQQVASQVWSETQELFTAEEGSALPSPRRPRRPRRNLRPNRHRQAQPAAELDQAIPVEPLGPEIAAEFDAPNDPILDASDELFAADSAVIL